MIEYYEFELMDQLMQHYFSSCATTLDTAEFVEPKYLRKLQRLLFKKFKRKMWVISSEYRKFKRYFKANKNADLDENLKAIYAKYNLEFKHSISGEANPFLKRPTEFNQVDNEFQRISSEGSGENASPELEQYDSTNSIEDENFEFDSLEQEDDQASANKKEQLEEQSSEENGLEPL